MPALPLVVEDGADVVVSSLLHPNAAGASSASQRKLARRERPLLDIFTLFKAPSA